MNTDITLHYIGYARRSSEDNKERQAASIPDQIYVLEDVKKKHKLSLIEILSESQSAFKTGRECFNQMLNRIELGEANAILTWHANRLARNMSDGGQIIYLMDEGKLLEIRTPSRSYKNTPEDKWMLSVEFANSKKDSDDKSVVVTRGLANKCRDGWRPGEAPQGYLNDKNTESGSRKIFSDKNRLPFMTKIFELFDGGTSVKEIHLAAKDKWHFLTRQRKRIGGKPLSISMIYAILNNTFYYGEFEYPLGSGNWYHGKHEPAITKDLFDRVQVKLGKRSKYKLQHNEYAYSALMKCGYCGSGIIAEQKWQCICSKCKLKFSLTKENKDKCPQCQTLIESMKSPKILHYIHYRCKHRRQINPPCNQKGLEVCILERLIDEKLSQVEISPLFMDWALRQIHKMNEDERNFREDTILAVNRAYDECRAKMDNLLQVYISPTNHDRSLLSDDRYKAENTKLETLLKDIEKQRSTVDQRMIEANHDIAKAFSFATLARQRFASGDLTTKRDIFMGLGSHLTLLDKIVHLDSPPYLFTLKKMKEEVPSIAEKVAPDFQSVRAKEMEALWASNSIVLRSRESHPA